MSSGSSRFASLAVRALWGTIAVPPLLLLFLLLGLLTGIGPARNGFWPRERLTLAEAVALRDGAAVRERLHAGDDPNAPQAVRWRVLHDRDTTATAFEVAAVADRADMLELLLEMGARPTADQVKAMFCLARPNAAPDPRQLLRDRLGATPPADCDGVRHP